jgi:hypothetical protein
MWGGPIMRHVRWFGFIATSGNWSGYVATEKKKASSSAVIG